MARQRRSTEERQREIAGAALRIISEKGVGGFTTAAISNEVGLAEGTIFRHFANKEAIALAAIGLLEEGLAESFPGEEVGEAPLERLGWFMRHRLELVFRHRGVLRAFFSGQLAMVAGEEGVRRMEAIKRRSMEFLSGCVREAAEEGSLRGGLPAEFFMQVIQGTVHAFLFGGTIRDYSRGDSASSDEVTPARIWGYLLRLISGCGEGDGEQSEETGTRS